MSSIALTPNINIAENIALNLKRLMSIYDIPTVAALAEELNINRMKLSRLLDGAIKRPKDKVLLPIANFFKITLEQLKGLQAIYWENIKGVLDFTTGTRIPVYSLNLDKDGNFVQEIVGGLPMTILTDTEVSDKSYSFIVKDSSLGIMFSEGTFAVCDPEKIPENNSYVLVKLKDQFNYMLRKLLIDIDDKYVRSPNPAISGSMRKMEDGDKIVATVVQIKLNL